MQVRPNRVGWAQPVAELICYACYAIGHMSFGCTHPISNIAAVINNYEKWTPDQKARVPDKAYRAALVMIKGTPENIASDEVAAAESPKN